MQLASDRSTLLTTDWDYQQFLPTHTPPYKLLWFVLLTNIIFRRALQTRPDNCAMKFAELLHVASECYLPKYYWQFLSFNFFCNGTKNILKFAKKFRTAKKIKTFYFGE